MIHGKFPEMIKIAFLGKQPRIMSVLAGMKETIAQLKLPQKLPVKILLLHIVIVRGVEGKVNLAKSV